MHVAMHRLKEGLMLVISVPEFLLEDREGGPKSDSV